MKKVVIVEDQTAIREMIALVLEADRNFSLVGETGDGQAAYDLCMKTQPDIIILDIMLPGLNGLEVLKRIRKTMHSTNILVFSGHPTASLVREALQAGANGFVEKTASLAELKKGILTVADGGTYFGPMTASFLRDAVLNPDAVGTSDVLTAREREVLQLIAESYTTKEIAAKLSVSPKTADNHRTNLMKKLNLHDVAGLTRYALRTGLIASAEEFTSGDMPP